MNRVLAEIDSVSEYLARITELERDAARFSIRCMRLEAALSERDAEIAKLRQQSSRANKVQPYEDGTYAYSAFVSLVHERLIDTNRWQTDFCQQSGIDRGRIAKWRISGRVPSDIFEAADRLNPATKRDRLGWSQEELDELKTRVERGEKYKDIATAFNDRWGREFTTNSITGMADRMKKKGKINA